MPRFHFELIEDDEIAKSHYGLELHEIAVNELDSAVDLAQLLAQRAANCTSGPVVVTISDEKRHPFARVRLLPERQVPAIATEVDERLMLRIQATPR